MYLWLIIFKNKWSIISHKYAFFVLMADNV